MDIFERAINLRIRFESFARLGEINKLRKYTNNDYYKVTPSPHNRIECSTNKSVVGELFVSPLLWQSYISYKKYSYNVHSQCGCGQTRQRPPWDM